MQAKLDNVAQTEALGAALAQACRAGCVLHLCGELGTGKTTLVRGMLRALGHAGSVRSPTYTLVEPYDLDGTRVYHLDLYRLTDPQELEYLGIRDFEADALCLIEWPERGGMLVPAADIVVRLDYAGEGRSVALSAPTGRGAACLEGLRWPQSS